ncbi:tRNA (adenosine(37)-N6)-threonylcarbamoyltransferase complex ATPase subunit type 1 TsaE [Candidatus Saccharibacteria bacterium]|nr:tRNA (adenosine(37)-N6)-threonylcarbamoyltransferase complex ATPase subunit type 1 TsaE [Candidatus Saccharibacteria bacterium]
MNVQTDDVTATEQLGNNIGSKLRGGEVIELISDLGGGKTTFVRGLAKGAGSKDHVSSPTFTVSKVYKSPKFEIHHFDFYRLSEAGVLVHELRDLLGDSKVVVVIEWGEIVQHVLPDTRLTIEINQTETEARDFYMTFSPAFSYLLGSGASK